jgi:hypothetical protein
MLEALGPLSRPAHSSVSVRRMPTVRSPRDEGGRRESLAGSVIATSIRRLPRSYRPLLVVISAAILAALALVVLRHRSNPLRTFLAFPWDRTHPQAESMADENGERRRQLLATGELEVADGLCLQVPMFLGNRMPVMAEEKARECLKLRRHNAPDDWKTFEAQGLMGNVLLLGGRYIDDEPHLLTAYEGMTQRYDRIPRDQRAALRGAIRDLMELYVVMGPAEKAIDWGMRLSAFDEANRAPE